MMTETLSGKKSLTTCIMNTLFICLCVFLLFTWTCSSQTSENAPQMTEDERAELELKIVEWEEQLLAEPNHFYLEYQLAIGYINLHNGAKGIEYMLKSIEDSPEKYKADLLFNLGYTYERMHMFEEAFLTYQECITVNPQVIEAYIKLAYMYNLQGKYEEVVNHLEQALKQDPSQAEIWMHLADTLNNLKRWPESISAYDRAIDIMKDDDEAVARMYVSQADTYSNMKQFSKAGELYKKAHRLDPSNPMMSIGLYRSKREMSEWSDWEPLMKRLEAVTNKELSQFEESNKPTSLSPYDTLYLELPLYVQHGIAKTWSHMEIKTAREAANFTVPYFHHDVTKIDEIKDQEKIRIGYISRRFEKYPGTQLMLRIFGLHNRDRYEVFGFATGMSDNSNERKIVETTCDTFIDLFGKSHIESASIISDMNIDILIDYDGLHSYNNLATLSLRPAPIQISYLGYAGTTGATAVVDYLVSDAFITPPDRNMVVQAYTERLLLLPYTYQPQDHLQPITMTNKASSRTSQGLPEDAFVFVCFNRNDKIDPIVFNSWMEILRKVPHSVLWLYDGGIKNHPAVLNMLNQAEAAGIDRTRLIFASKMPKGEHIARHKLADLFLDTLFYNAHTCTTDALYAGLPVLTLPGRGFSSRVAGSLLHAAGLPELVANNMDAYIHIAVRLAMNEFSPSLAELKERLDKQRNAFPLFNTPQYVKDLETGYEMILEKHSETLDGDAYPIIVPGQQRYQ